jgi:hypothetical protein
MSGPSRSLSRSPYERITPGQHEQVGGAHSGDHVHMRVSFGPVTNFVYTTGRGRSRKPLMRRWIVGSVSRAPGTSCGAPSRTKSFCMSTTTIAAFAGSSVNAGTYPVPFSAHSLRHDSSSSPIWFTVCSRLQSIPMKRA